MSHAVLPATSPRRLGVTTWTAILVSLTALVVYVRTAAPSIVWGDSPELTAAAYNLGVAHPPGYPLYMLLGHLFIRLVPFGDAAFRMNLFSAVCAAAAVGVVYLVALRLVRRSGVAAAAALAFAFGRTFWGQAVLAEVYALHALWMAVVVLLALEWERKGETRWLRWAALAYGLSFTHHLMSVLLLPALVYLGFSSRRRGDFLRELRWTLPLFLAPLLLYAYVPIAAMRDTATNWNDPRTWKNFMLHVTGWEYQGRMFSKSPDELWHDLLRFAGSPWGRSPGFLFTELSIVAVGLAVVGIASLFRRNRRVLGFTALVYGTVVLYAVNYKIGDIDAYYLTAHMILTLWMACGLRVVLTAARRLWKTTRAPISQRPRLTGMVSASLFILPLGLATRHWTPNDLHGSRNAITYAQSALARFDPDALVLAVGDVPALPLQYPMSAEGKRPDILFVQLTDLMYPHRLRLITRLRNKGLVVNPPQCFLTTKDRVHTHDCLLQALVADNIGKRPVYVVAAPEKFDQSAWLTSLSANYWRRDATNFYVTELTNTPPNLNPPHDHPQQAARLAFGRSPGDRLELLGYDAEPVRKDDSLFMRVRYYWRCPDPSLIGAVRVRAALTTPDGVFRDTPEGPGLTHDHVLGQTHGPTRVPVSDVFCETMELFVPPDLRETGLSLWVNVEKDGKPLGGGNPGGYAQIGELPAAAGATRTAHR
jgi:hypothetical protein